MVTRIMCPVLNKDDKCVIVEIRARHDAPTMCMIYDYIHLFGSEQLSYVKICPKNVRFYYGDRHAPIMCESESIASIVRTVENETEIIGA